MAGVGVSVRIALVHVLYATSGGRGRVKVSREGEDGDLVGMRTAGIVPHLGAWVARAHCMNASTLLATADVGTCEREGGGGSVPSSCSRPR